MTVKVGVVEMKAPMLATTALVYRGRGVDEHYGVHEGTVLAWERGEGAVVAWYCGDVSGDIRFGTVGKPLIISLHEPVELWSLIEAQSLAEFTVVVIQISEYSSRRTSRL